MRFWQTMHPRDRRALTVGSLVVGSALCISLVVRPFFHARATLRDQLHEQRGLLARESGLIASTEHGPANRIAVTRAVAAVGDQLFTEKDPLAATASLVNLVGDAARRQGVLLESIEAGAPEVIGGTLVAVRVDVRGRGDLEGLLRWLAVLEGSRRLVRVEQLGVARTGAEFQPGTREAEVLSLVATVRGFLLSSAEETVPAGFVSGGNNQP